MAIELEASDEELTQGPAERGLATWELVGDAFDLAVKSDAQARFPKSSFVLFVYPSHAFWMDKKGIDAGSDWRLEIAKALHKATHVLFLASNNSLTSRYCHEELMLACKQEKPIVFADISVYDADRDVSPVEEVNSKIKQLCKEAVHVPCYRGEGIGVLARTAYTTGKFESSHFSVCSLQESLLALKVKAAQDPSTKTAFPATPPLRQSQPQALPELPSSTASSDRAVLVTTAREQPRLSPVIIKVGFIS